MILLWPILSRDWEQILHPIKVMDGLNVKGLVKLEGARAELARLTAEPQ